MAGITMKNTMMRPWPVTNTLNTWPLAKYCMPGSCSSMRITTDRKPPIRPAMMANSRYSVPMSLWLVENSHAARTRRACARGRHDRVARSQPWSPCRLPSQFALRRRDRRDRASGLPLGRRRHCPTCVALATFCCAAQFDRRAADDLAAPCLRSRAFTAAAQSLKTCSFTTRTAIGMKAWSLPHSSEHWPK